MKIFVAMVFYLSYWAGCFIFTGTDKKNIGGLRSYPDVVQKTVLEHTELFEKAPRKKSVLSILIGNWIFFTVIFSALGIAMKNALGLNDFKTAFWFFFMLGEGLGLFDFFVIDLLWWRNTKRSRFFVSAGEKILSKYRKTRRLFSARHTCVCGSGGTQRRVLGGGGSDFCIQLSSYRELYQLGVIYRIGRSTCYIEYW